MAGETTITIVGNPMADPEIRQIGDGAAVASFTITSTPRTFDRSINPWEDGEAMFMRCSTWRGMGKNIAGSPKKGMWVIASGRLQQRSWETQQGGRHTIIGMTVDEIGSSLRYVMAHVERNQCRDTGFGGQSGYGGAGYGRSGGLAGGNYANSFGGSGGQGSGGAPSQSRYGSGGNQGDSGGGQGGADDPWGSPAGGFGSGASQSSSDQGPPFQATTVNAHKL